MGRPINKRYFGSGAGDQIKVRAKVGANAEGDGVIVSQRGSKKFKVTVGGNTGDCFLVDKANGALANNEMTITVLTDDGVLRRVTKITAHRVTTSAGSFAWTFDASTVDGKVEINEVETGVAAPVITITAQPVNASVTEPATATFTVTATATQGVSLSYQWQKAESSAPTVWTNVSTGTGGLTASYTTEATAVAAGAGATNGDLYRVIVSATGADDVRSSPATLTVA